MADRGLIRPIIYPNSSRAEYRTSEEIQKLNLPMEENTSDESPEDVVE